MRVSGIQSIGDLPAPRSGSSAWLGSRLARHPEDWLYTLSSAETAALKNAAQRFLAAEQDLGALTPERFPLEKMDELLTRLRRCLLGGPGFQVLRGLPMADLPLDVAAAVFCGIGAHLGNARSQNARGHLLGHVRDDGEDASDPNTRIYQTNERQTFHTDSADVVGLMCIRNASEGGDSLLVSAETIYNRMYVERPDLLCLLFDPIATDRRGEVPDGERPFVEIPVFSWHAGYLTVFYQRQYIDSAQRFDGVLRLTSQHVAALDLFDSLANDPELHLRMRLEPGDLQFVYNHALLHDRTAFIDDADPAKRRYLLRLWLSMPGDRPLPGAFGERYGSVEIGNRGGIVTRVTRLHASLATDSR